MGKVIFTISYDVNPAKRDEYLALVQSMKDHFVKTNGKEYSVYEHKGKKNSFSEVFLFKNMDEYDQLEEDDEMSQLVAQLESVLLDRKMRYSTLVELE
jgi:quinol monooxygenase YgiN